jgi:hypothetical protein
MDSEASMTSGFLQLITGAARAQGVLSHSRLLDTVATPFLLRLILTA